MIMFCAVRFDILYFLMNLLNPEGEIKIMKLSL